MERRKVPRVTLTYAAKISVEQKEIMCSLKNLTAGGALILIDSEHHRIISREDVGKPVLLNIGFGISSENRSFDGLITRVDAMDNLKFVAVKFYSPENISEISEE